MRQPDLHLLKRALLQRAERSPPGLFLIVFLAERRRGGEVRGGAPFSQGGSSARDRSWEVCQRVHASLRFPRLPATTEIKLKIVREFDERTHDLGM